MWPNVRRGFGREGSGSRGIKASSSLAGHCQNSSDCPEDMDTWRIQLAVVAFCALMQTNQAAVSSTVDEERSLSPVWQVSFTSIGQIVSWLRTNVETFRCIGISKTFINTVNVVKMFFYLSGWVSRPESDQPAAQSDEKIKGASLLWTHGKTFRSAECKQNLFAKDKTFFCFFFLFF